MTKIYKDTFLNSSFGDDKCDGFGNGAGSGDGDGKGARAG